MNRIPKIMSCGCKKKPQPTSTPATQQNVSDPTKLTQQDKLVNEIINKVRELSR